MFRSRPWPGPRADTLLIGGLLTALIALGQLSSAIYMPSLPSMIEVMHSTPERVSLTLSVFLAGFALSQLVFGPLSDRYGRRVTLIAGTALFVLASITCALVNSIEALIAARFFQAVGACTGAVVGRAVVRDAYGRERAARALAYIGIAFSLSPAVSPIIGGYLQEAFGWRAAFVFLAVAGAIVLVATVILLDETNVEPEMSALDPRGMARNFASLLADRTFVAYMLGLSLVFAGMMAFVTGSPFLFINAIGASPAHYGMYAAMSSVGTLFGSLIAGRYALRIGVRRMMLLGMSICILGGLAMTGFALAGFLNPAVIILPVLVFLCGMGIVMPNGMAGAMGPFPRIAGSASALLGFVQMGAAALGSAIVGHLSFTTQLPLGLCMLGLTVLGLLMYMALIPRN